MDLWLNQSDLAVLEQLTTTYNTSKQRMIETALAYCSALDTPLTPQENYKRSTRIVLNLDDLAILQLEQLSQAVNASNQTALRSALQRFAIVWNVAE
ncbi:MAG: hypothetical protein AAF639_17745 [Chloroflexota bacterium]